MGSGLDVVVVVVVVVVAAGLPWLTFAGEVFLLD